MEDPLAGYLELLLHVPGSPWHLTFFFVGLQGLPGDLGVAVACLLSSLFEMNCPVKIPGI